jgi:hypothetical protein
VLEFPLGHLRSSRNASPPSFRIKLCAALLSVTGTLGTVLSGCVLSIAHRRVHYPDGGFLLCLGLAFGNRFDS